MTDNAGAEAAFLAAAETPGDLAAGEVAVAPATDDGVGAADDGGGKLAPVGLDPAAQPQWHLLADCSDPANADAAAAAAAAAADADKAADHPSLIDFGIPRSALLAPVAPPPRKKRRAEPEFTIAKKLEILAELRRPDAPSVLDLAKAHGTSRQSIYRWKKDETRLDRLCKRKGLGDAKRVSASRAGRGSRRGFNEEYTAAEKLAVVRELRGEDAPSVRSLGERMGLNHRSIYRWKKEEERLERLVEQEGKGGRKRNGEDPLNRIKEALRLFRDTHYPVNGEETADQTDQNQGGQRQPRLTGALISIKAKQIRDEMLAQHEVSPFLTEDEEKCMRQFTGSESWGRKIMQQPGWPKEASADGKAHDVSFDPKSATEKKPSIPSPRPRPRSLDAAKKGKLTDKISAMKGEIISLKRMLTVASQRNEDLQKENDQLRAHLATLTNNQMLREENARMAAMISALGEGGGVTAEDEVAGEVEDEANAEAREAPMEEPESEGGYEDDNAVVDTYPAKDEVAGGNALMENHVGFGSV